MDIFHAITFLTGILVGIMGMLQFLPGNQPAYAPVKVKKCDESCE